MLKRADQLILETARFKSAMVDSIKRQERIELLLKHHGKKLFSAVADIAAGTCVPRAIIHVGYE